MMSGWVELHGPAFRQQRRSGPTLRAARMASWRPAVCRSRSTARSTPYAAGQGAYRIQGVGRTRRTSSASFLSRASWQRTGLTSTPSILGSGPSPWPASGWPGRPGQPDDHPRRRCRRCRSSPGPRRRCRSRRRPGRRRCRSARPAAGTRSFCVMPRM